jgi:hypothetical protein
MDRTTAGEVEAWKLEQPAVGVPGPVCNGAVHDSCPKKAEDHGRHDTATLERPTDDYHSGTCAEEEFIEAEDNLGKDGGANRWCGHYLLT